MPDPIIPRLSDKILDEKKLNHDGSNPVTGNINMTGHQLLNLVLQKYLNLPSTAPTAQLAYNTVKNCPSYFNGTKWVDIDILGIWAYILNLSGGGSGGVIDDTSSAIKILSLELIHKINRYKCKIDPYNAHIFTYNNYMSDVTMDEACDSGVAGGFQSLELKGQGDVFLTGNILDRLRIGAVIRETSEGEKFTDSGYFNSYDGAEVIHNFGTKDHYVMIGSNVLNDPYYKYDSKLDVFEAIGDVGVVWVKLGENSDIIYNTGNASNYKFDYFGAKEVTKGGTLAVENGITFPHTVGHKDRVLAYTLVTTENYIDTDRVGNIGDIYPVLGSNYDTMYISGESYQDMKLQVISHDCVMEKATNSYFTDTSIEDVSYLEILNGMEDIELENYIRRLKLANSDTDSGRIILNTPDEAYIALMNQKLR